MKAIKSKVLWHFQSLPVTVDPDVHLLVIRGTQRAFMATRFPRFLRVMHLVKVAQGRTP